MGLVNEVFAGMPGILDAVETPEMEVFWGREEVNRTFVIPAVIAAVTVDAGASPTSVLRPGLLMGYVPAGADPSAEQWTHWDDAETNGSEVLRGVLLYAANMSERGVAVQRYFGWIAIGGQLKSRKLLVPGNASHSIIGDGKEAAIRTAFASSGSAFMLDDEYQQ